MAGHTIGELERLLKKARGGWRVARRRARDELASLVRTRVNRLYAARSSDSREALAHDVRAGIDSILVEFAIPVAVYENAMDMGSWDTLARAIAPEISAVIPASYRHEPGLLLCPRQLELIASELAKSLGYASFAPALPTDTRARAALRNLTFAPRWRRNLQEELSSTLALVITQVTEQHGFERARSTLLGAVELLRRVDVEAALFLYRIECSAPITQVVWRGGRVAYALEDGVRLVRLANGAWALLSRGGDGWLWTEGSRDEVLAVVPDAFFEPAVLAGMNTPAAA
ncbi:MAG: hypothetical protein U0271_02905 [Polyangiaceae bacterium]